MRLERISSLAKYVLCQAQNAAWIHATQWFERTLDDSASRRLSIPQCFLAIDALLVLCVNVVRGLVVHPEVIRRRLDEELPFMASETVLMLATKAGGDRGELHEAIRRHAMEVARERKERGARNDLLERLAGDPAFASVQEQIHDYGDPSAHIGGAPQQVEAFFRDEVDPWFEKFSADTGAASWEVSV